VAFAAGGRATATPNDASNGARDEADDSHTIKPAVRSEHIERAKSQPPAYKVLTEDAVGWSSARHITFAGRRSGHQHSRWCLPRRLVHGARVAFRGARAVNPASERRATLRARTRSRRAGGLRDRDPRVRAELTVRGGDRRARQPRRLLREGAAL